jgi:tetratricopeptide (TPR) repeat protein
MNELILEGNLLLDKYEKDKRAGRELLSDIKDAIVRYTRAIELGCREAEAYGKRAAAYNWLNNYESAFADICRAIELDPENGGYLFNRGIAYAEKEDWENAFSDFFNAIETYSTVDHEESELDKIKSTAKIIYQWRFKKIFEDKFYLLLQNFCGEHGKDIFYRETFRPLLLDFASGEYKKEVKALLGILEQSIFVKFKESENPEAARKRIMQISKDHPGHITDILCCLLLYDDFFGE